MHSFEGLRPIITNHFYFDWLTKFPVKDVIAFQQRQDQDADLDNTSQFINATMNDVMSQKGLLWGISNKNDNQFIGVAGIANLNDETVTIYVNVISMDDNEELEIIKRMLQMKENYFADKPHRFMIKPLSDSLDKQINNFNA